MDEARPRGWGAAAATKGRGKTEGMRCGGGNEGKEARPRGWVATAAERGSMRAGSERGEAQRGASGVRRGGAGGRAGKGGEAASAVEWRSELGKTMEAGDIDITLRSM